MLTPGQIQKHPQVKGKSVLPCVALASQSQMQPRHMGPWFYACYLSWGLPCPVAHRTVASRKSQVSREWSSASPQGHRVLPQDGNTLISFLAIYFLLRSHLPLVSTGAKRPGRKSLQMCEGSMLGPNCVGGQDLWPSWEAAAQNSNNVEGGRVPPNP